MFWKTPANRTESLNRPPPHSGSGDVHLDAAVWPSRSLVRFYTFVYALAALGVGWACVSAALTRPLWALVGLAVVVLLAVLWWRQLKQVRQSAPRRLRLDRAGWWLDVGWGLEPVQLEPRFGLWPGWAIAYWRHPDGRCRPRVLVHDSLSRADWHQLRLFLATRVVY